MLAADAIVTLAETMKSDMVARGVPAERIHIVPNGVEQEAFQPRCTRSGSFVHGTASASGSSSDT